MSLVAIMMDWLAPSLIYNALSYTQKYLTLGRL